MTTAIISDIHGNLEALEAVLVDAREKGATRIICLGDLVVYGPDSIECVRRTREFEVVVAGEMDRSLLEPDGAQWNPTITKNLKTLKSKFEQQADWYSLEQTLRNYAHRFEEDRCLLVHGTPGNRRTYLFPEDSFMPQMLTGIASQFDLALFSGSAHIAGLLVQTNKGNWSWVQPDYRATYTIKEGQKLICTVGSVGQPRDEDWRASYVLWNGRDIRFRRVEYDRETTKRKIHDDPDLDDLNGDRLDRGI